MNLSNCSAVYRDWINAVLPRLWAFTKHLKSKKGALVGMAQLVGTSHQKVAGSNPGQGTYPDFGFSPSRGVCRRQLICVSLSQINQNFKKEGH